MNVAVLAVSCVNNEMRTPMTTLHFKPVKKLLAEHLMKQSPPTGFKWLNIYLEKIRFKVFSLDNLVPPFATPDGSWRHGLHIGSILDNIFKFRGKHK
jgi:hypothetical protein